jgi:predicted thioesterase
VSRLRWKDGQRLGHAIDFAEGGTPAVLSTPWLIWFLEHAARAAVLPLLEPGESTVGMEIQVQHLAPTPVGHSYRFVCRPNNVSASARNPVHSSNCVAESRAVFSQASAPL